MSAILDVCACVRACVRARVCVCVFCPNQRRVCDRLIGFGDGITYYYAEQTAAAASFGFAVMALGFLLCGPSANHERIEYAHH